MFLGCNWAAFLLAMQTRVLLASDRHDGSSLEEFTTFHDVWLQRGSSAGAAAGARSRGVALPAPEAAPALGCPPTEGNFMRVGEPQARHPVLTQAEFPVN